MGNGVASHNYVRSLRTVQLARDTTACKRSMISHMLNWDLAAYSAPEDAPHVEELGLTHDGLRRRPLELNH
jgi:hypothetical protein